MTTSTKQETIPQIIERTGKTHAETVSMIRDGMRNRTCRGIGMTGLYEFDEPANDEAEIEAETDRNLSKSGMFDSCGGNA